MKDKDKWVEHRIGGGGTMVDTVEDGMNMLKRNTIVHKGRHCTTTGSVVEYAACLLVVGPPEYMDNPGVITSTLKWRNDVEQFWYDSIKNSLGAPRPYEYRSWYQSYVLWLMGEHSEREKS